MWTYVLSELDGTEIGEVADATGRSLSIGLNRAATASFTIRADNSMTVPLYSADKLLKVYEDGTLRFHGNVVSTELASAGTEAPTVQVTAANPAWRLARRLIGLSAGGTTYTGDKAKSARKIISEINSGAAVGSAEYNPHTGIKLLGEGSYVGGSGTYVAGPYRGALAAINDLAHTLTGFDWYISPLEGSETVVTTNESGSWTTPLIGQFEANNAFGSSKDVVFEYGYGQKNVRTINYIRDLSELTNKAYHLPNDLETEAVLGEISVPSVVTRGRYEAVADAFGLTNTVLREAWLDEVIRVKHNPRFVVTATLDIDDGKGRVPQLGTDYWLGDIVTARGYINGTELFNGLVRVYGVEVSINEAGTGAYTPILVDEEGESL
jgi:hypothetical protein